MRGQCILGLASGSIRFQHRHRDGSGFIQPPTPLGRREILSVCRGEISGHRVPPARACLSRLGELARRLLALMYMSSNLRARRECERVCESFHNNNNFYHCWLYYYNNLDGATGAFQYSMAIKGPPSAGWQIKTNACRGKRQWQGRRVAINVVSPVAASRAACAHFASLWFAS